MEMFDQDLHSIQEARILAENAKEAQQQLKQYSDHELNTFVEGISCELKKHIRELAECSVRETGYGNANDKYQKNKFVCEMLPQELLKQRYTGIIKEDYQKKTIDIGVPAGAVAAFLPSTNPVSTAIYKTLIAIKSANAVVFSPHPGAAKVTRKVLDLMIHTAAELGLPEGAISYRKNLSKAGSLEMMNHSAMARILITGVPSLLKEAAASGKPVIYGGAGNGPVFIERTANIEKAVSDIIRSKTFDYGTVSGAEQAVVAERCITAEVTAQFELQGGRFLSESETRLFSEWFRRHKKWAIGKSAAEIAAKAGIKVDRIPQVLLIRQQDIHSDNPFIGQNLCPILTYYIENDWRFACEKCIELLIGEEMGHTLVIHSKNEDVIREFALKKPVARMLVNTPAVLGGMGMTTNLFPAMTLGSAAPGTGVSADNISPWNLVYIRKVGYGVRSLEVDQQPEISTELVNLLQEWMARR